MLLKTSLTRSVYLLWLLSVGVSASVNTADPAAEALFEQLFEEHVALSPLHQAYLGRKTNYHLWDDISPAQDERLHALNKNQLKRLQQLKPGALNATNRLSYELMDYQLRRDIAAYRWRDHNYPVNQMFGLHSQVPSFLINNHQIDSEEDARAYIARLEGVAALMEQLIANLDRRAKKGIIAPAFVYPYVIADSTNLIRGAPFQEKEDDSPLLKDFRKKVDDLSLTEQARAHLLQQAERALITSVQPGYQKLTAYLQKLAKKADDRAGAWKLPAGQDFYKDIIKRTTTTELSPEAIHSLGLDEVQRIHGEMQQLLKRVKFDGTLPEFFVFMRDAPQFFYPNTEAGRAAYLEDTQAIIDGMEKRLNELFGRLPKAKLVVKAVEPFREKSAGKAFYQSPAEDGSRPGIYYINLHDMTALPKYQMEALAFHEALPGHHMQIALAQEAEGLPSFRKHGFYTAYIEGWGLYAERIPKEMGFYSDPYSDFGRLSMELWRAVRLVVDTGMHSKKWTREQAVNYFVQQTPMTRADAVREVERYIVMPGQATAYKVGMNRILAIRAQAEQQLGDTFDVKAFHDLVLDGGALPLTVLEQRVAQWLAEQTAQAGGGD